LENLHVQNDWLFSDYIISKACLPYLEFIILSIPHSVSSEYMKSFYFCEEEWKSFYIT